MTLTQESLKELLDYTPETGIFTWKIARCNAIKVGSRAGCLDTSGYRRLNLNGKLWLEHQLVFLYMEGTIPKEIDHINNVKSDNRYTNLRQCNRAQNQHNKGKQKRNTSGVKGVCWFEKGGYYVAQYQINYSSKSKLFRPRNFSSKEEALLAATLWVQTKREQAHDKFANHS
jgi:hypothetical protein